MRSFLIALSLAFSTHPVFADPDESPDATDDAKVDYFGDSIVKLTPEAREVAKSVVDRVARLATKTGICAGSLVGKDLVLTAWHCVDKVRNVRVSWYDGKNPRAGHVVAKDPDHDVAVLRLDAPVPQAPLVVAPIGKPLAVGEPVIAIGHPYDQDFKVTGGSAIKTDRSFFLFDAQVKPGNSGGPVLNLRGEIVGVAIILNQLFGEREISDATGVEPIEAVLQAAEPRQALGWTDAKGVSELQLGGGRDGLLDELSGQKGYASFQYGLFYDWHDRVRLGFQHLIMRPERVYGWDIGYVFKEVLGNPGLLLGRNYYYAHGDALVANKLGLTFMLGPFEIQVFQIRHEDDSYVSWAVTL